MRCGLNHGFLRIYTLLVVGMIVCMVTLSVMMMIFYGMVSCIVVSILYDQDWNELVVALHNIQ